MCKSLMHASRMSDSPAFPSDAKNAMNSKRTKFMVARRSSKSSRESSDAAVSNEVSNKDAIVIDKDEGTQMQTWLYEY